MGGFLCFFLFVERGSICSHQLETAGSGLVTFSTLGEGNMVNKRGRESSNSQESHLTREILITSALLAEKIMGKSMVSDEN